MANAICIKCGSAKRCWTSKCPECEFDPCTNTEDEAKSYILSTERFDDGNDPAERMGLPDFEEHELDMIGKQIREGKDFEFNAADVECVVSTFEIIKNMTWKDSLIMFLTVLWWFVPIYILIAIFWAIGSMKSCA